MMSNYCNNFQLALLRHGGGNYEKMIGVEREGEEEKRERERERESGRETRENEKDSDQEEVVH